MSSRISFEQIKKNIGLSVIAQVISLAVSFVMNLVLPKYISEYQYALWQTYLLYIGYVGILHFGLLDGIVLRYSQYDYDELDKNILRSQFKCLLGLTGFFCMLGILCASVFCKAEAKMIFAFVSVGIVTRTMFTYTSYSFQITNRIKGYAKMVIGYRVFYGLFTILLLRVGVQDFYFFCLVDICSDIFGTAFSYAENKEMYWGRSLCLRSAITEAKQNIKAGAMLMISNWSSFLLTGSARMIIQWHWDKLTFGKVSFAFSMTNLFLTFVTAISIVLFPSLKRTDRKLLPDLYKRIRNMINPLLISVLILYYPGCWILNKWIPKYQPSLEYLGILLPMIIFSSKIGLLTNNYLKTLRKEKAMLVINLISVTIAIFLFVLGAYVFNNLKLLLVFIVLAMMLCSMFSETVVMKELNIFTTNIFAEEIFMTAVFVFSTSISNNAIGFIIYLVADMILWLLNKYERT